MTKLIGISGSLRKASTNTALLKEAARLFGGAELTLADIRMPLYNGDLEEESGLPKEALKLREQISEADAVLISSPEYNSNISGVLKNALDWISREKPSVFQDKPVAIMSAAAGRTGGARSQFSVRHCLTPFNPRILQLPEVMIAASYAAFDDNGLLKDEASVSILTTQMNALKAMI